MVWRWGSGKRGLSEAMSRKDCEAGTLSPSVRVESRPWLREIVVVGVGGEEMEQTYPALST